MDPVEAAIRAFAAPKRAGRYLSLLGTPRGRARMRATLAHAFELDLRYATRLSGADSLPPAVAKRLRALGAPNVCYCLSENSQIDGRELPLDEALAATVGYQMGTLISCIPGALCYYEGEDSGERYVLQRAAA